MRKKHYLILGIVSILGAFLISDFIDEASYDEAQNKKWEAVRNADVAKVSGGWQTPVWIGEVNSEGWEDGAYISSDGDELYFAYTNIDLFRLPDVVEIGPDRDASKVCNPSCGQFPRVDVFYSVKDSSGRWQKPVPHPLTIEFPIGGIVFVNPNKSYFMKYSDTSKDDIWYADFDGVNWDQNKVDGVSSPYNDADPYVTPTDDQMFFSSDRPVALGGDNIFYSKKVGGKWHLPELLPEPVNSDANDMQPFLFGDTLYFSSDRDGKLNVYKSVRNGDIWSDPEISVESKNAVGEPTLTADGSFLYFIQLFVADDGTPNPEIMYVERR